MPPVDTNKAEQKWPLAAMIAVGSLLTAVVMMAWMLHLQKHTLVRVQQTAQQHEQQQAVFQQQILALMAEQQQDRQNEIGFMTKQHHYAELMGLLSETYVHTARLDQTALEETNHQVKQAYFALEPFLSNQGRDWLLQQVHSIHRLSAKLAESSQEYEDNLLATKTHLRQMIDETHQHLYPLLFTASSIEKGNESANKTTTKSEQEFSP